MWFDGGKDDPDVVLLRMPLHEAAVWLNEAGTLRFGIEMVRGAMSDHDPEVGEQGLWTCAAAPERGTAGRRCRTHEGPG